MPPPNERTPGAVASEGSSKSCVVAAGLDCECTAHVEHRLELLARHLGVDIDVLVAQDAFEQSNGAVDADVWLLSQRNPRAPGPRALRQHVARLVDDYGLSAVERALSEAVA